MKTTHITRYALLLSLAAMPFGFAQTEKKETVIKEETTIVKEGKVPAPGSIASVIHDGVTFSILAKAVKAADGEVHHFEAPKARDLPRVLVADAQSLGFRLDPGAADSAFRCGHPQRQLASNFRTLSVQACSAGA